MLALPATTNFTALSQLTLLVNDRPDVPQRVMATCCRRQGTVVALAFERGGPDGTAELELAVEVEPRLRRALIDRIAGLVDVLEVRRPAARGSGG
jgi:acetolactate synthase regulatory subunit